MRKCYRIWMCLAPVFVLAMALPGWTATNNSGNPPTFLHLDICTNGIGDSSAYHIYPRMEPDVFDIGVDLDADGTIDRWLSQETTEYFGRENADIHRAGELAALLYPA